MSKIPPQMVQLLVVLAICAVTLSLLGKGAPPLPSLRIDPELLTIDGIRLGMTEAEVSKLKGAPASRETGLDGSAYLTFEGMEFAIEFAVEDKEFKVSSVMGNVVGVGSTLILKPGEGKFIPETLKSLGKPNYREHARCGFSVSPLSLLTFGYFDDLDGTLVYPNGLAVEVIDGRYVGAILDRKP